MPNIYYCCYCCLPLNLIQALLDTISSLHTPFLKAKKCVLYINISSKKSCYSLKKKDKCTNDISNLSIFLNISNENVSIGTLFVQKKKTDPVVKADKAKFLVTFAALILQSWRSIAELPPAKLWPEYIDK